jgi:hypothetical protein
MDPFVEAAAEAFKADEPAPALNTLTPLGALLLAEFAKAEIDRRETEERLLKDLRQYLGIYEPDIEKSLAGRSKTFTRKTRVKVRAADSRMFDLLFPASSTRNFQVTATAVPKVGREQINEIATDLKTQLQREPEGWEVAQSVKEWVSDRAKKMGDTIDDQLVEAKYRRLAKKVLHSGHVYGTGILKGPLVERKMRARYVQERSSGKWAARVDSYATPFVDFVPIWRFYPDMGPTEICDCRYVYELHRMSKHALQKLGERKSFDGPAIKAYLLANPKGQMRPRTVETELRQLGERNTLSELNSGQYEIVERWGWLDADALTQVGVKIPLERMHETFFSNVWVLPDGTVVKAVLQQFDSLADLYHLYQFDSNETNIFANGISAIMRDDQDAINASTRMILDNGAITSGPQIEVNVRAMSGLTDLTTLTPFKLWLRTGEDAGSPALRAINFDSHLTELIQIRQLFDENADEVTSIPRYLSGENPVQGAAGTSTGMSMLMGAASIGFKDQVADYDEGITKPFITGLYRWNMRFNPDESIKGDFDVSATGASSLVAKEVRSAQLAQFGQSIQAEERPFVNWYKLLRQRVLASEIPEDVLKDEDTVKREEQSDEAKRQQELMRKQQELTVSLLENKVAKLAAEMEKLHAATVQANVDAAYAAMQAGGVAAMNVAAASGGDEILRSAGWVDSTPQDTTSTAVEEGPAAEAAQPGLLPAVNPNVAQAQPVAPRVGSLAGHERGIRTPEIEQ